MRHRGFPNRSTLSIFALASAFFTTTAWADVDQCVEAHSQGQILRDDNRLTEAEASFLACASDEGCPAPVREECEQYLADVARLTPSVVFTARDENGQDVEGVRVYSNGEFLTDVGQTTPLPMNPGEYHIRFVHESGRSSEVKLLVVPGEKARIVSAVFEAPSRPVAAEAVSAPAPPPPGNVRRITTYAFGGLALAGLAGFAVFGLQGKASEDELRASCAPNCSAAQRRSVASKYLLADISLAVFGVAAAGGAALYFIPPAVGSDELGALGFRGEF